MILINYSWVKILLYYILSLSMLKFQDISAFLGLHAEPAEHVHPSVGQVRQRMQRWESRGSARWKKGPPDGCRLAGNTMD